MIYDVVRQQKNDSSITYHCINDMEETLLFAELDQKVQQQMDHQDNGGTGILAKKILKAISANLYLNANYPNINQPIYYLIHESGYKDHLTAPAREILTPPPQVWSCIYKTVLHKPVRFIVIACACIIDQTLLKLNLWKENLSCPY